LTFGRMGRAGTKVATVAPAVLTVKVKVPWT
jgi:hypothetical protein